MKKFILPLAIAAIFSACNTEKKDDTQREMVILNDSLYRNNVSSDTGTSIVAEPAIGEPIAVKPAAPRKTITKSPRKTYNPPVVSNVPNNPAPLPTNTGTTTPNTSSTPTTGTTADNAGTNTGTDNTTTTVPEKKEGWSKAAKGAAIGGVAGAVAGAILTKKGTGAVIGGVVGAAGGYILGRKKDKADGRVN
ncbi:MAG TPA: YMGG-like glycine zipper-containing protein [Ferruginibacter sp.]|nr:YMGG-like glycine zipper-containing protein [Ferruginibacter sp.]